MAITDVLASWVAPMGSIAEGASSQPTAATLPGMGVFRTVDNRWVELGVFSEDHLWDALCDALGLPQLVGIDMVGRTADALALRAAIEASVAGRTRDELVALLTGRGVPAAPVLTREEMLERPNNHERGVVVTDADGRRRLGHAIRYAVHPALPPGRPPALDEHADATFT